MIKYLAAHLPRNRVSFLALKLVKNYKIFLKKNSTYIPLNQTKTSIRISVLCDRTKI